MQVALPTQVEVGATPGSLPRPDLGPKLAFGDVLQQQATTQPGPSRKPQFQAPAGAPTKRTAQAPVLNQQPTQSPPDSLLPEQAAPMVIVPPAMAGTLIPNPALTSTGPLLASSDGISISGTSSPAETLAISTQPGTTQNTDQQPQPSPAPFVAGESGWTQTSGPPQDITADPLAAGSTPASAKEVEATPVSTIPASEVAPDPPARLKSKAATLEDSPLRSKPAAVPGHAGTSEPKLPPAKIASTGSEHASRVSNARNSGVLRSEAKDPNPGNTGSTTTRSQGPEAQPTSVQAAAPTYAGTLSFVPPINATTSTSQSTDATPSPNKQSDQSALPVAEQPASEALPSTGLPASPTSALPGFITADQPRPKELPAVGTLGPGLAAGEPGTAASERSNLPAEAHATPGQASTASRETELHAAEIPELTRARLMQTLTGSQMQVSVRSEDFGKVTVHAGYGRDALSAQITLESPQLGAALSTHIPAMEQRLAGEHGMRTSVVIAAAADGQGAQNAPKDSNPQSDRSPSSYRSSKTSPTYPGTTETSAIAVDPTQFTTTTQAPSGRLNVRI